MLISGGEDFDSLKALNYLLAFAIGLLIVLFIIGISSEYDDQITLCEEADGVWISKEGVCVNPIDLERN